MAESPGPFTVGAAEAATPSDIESAQNRAIVRSLYEAAEHGAPDVILSALDDDINLRIPESLPYGGVHRGREAVSAALQLAAQYVDAAGVQVEQLLADSDRVAALAWVKGLTGTTLEGIRIPLIELWRLRNAKVVEVAVFYWDTAALTDALSGATEADRLAELTHDTS